MLCYICKLDFSDMLWHRAVTFERALKGPLYPYRHVTHAKYVNVSFIDFHAEEVKLELDR